MRKLWKAWMWIIAGLNFGDAIIKFESADHWGFINFIIGVVLVYLVGIADGRDYIV